MNLEKRIENELTKFLESDVIEEKINKSLNEVVDSALDSLFGSWGAVTKVVKQQIEDSMVPIIEKYDYSQYVLKLDAVLTEVLKEASEPSNLILNKFKTLTSKVPEEMNLEMLFEKYVDHVGKEIDTSNLEEDGEGRYEDANVTLSVEKSDRYSYYPDEHVVLQFRCEEDEKMNLDLDAYQSCNGKWRVRSGVSQTEIANLRHLSEFECYLLALDSNFTEFELEVGDEFEDYAEIVASPYD